MGKAAVLVAWIFAMAGLALVSGSLVKVEAGSFF